MSKLKTALAGIDRHCIEGQDLNDQALDNEITHKAALAATRKALQGVRAHLDAAFEELRNLRPTTTRNWHGRKSAVPRR